MEVRKKYLICFLIVLIIIFSVLIYTNIYLKYIKIAILYSDPYNKDELQTISDIAEENINKYFESMNSRYRFKNEIIYMSVKDLLQHNNTIKYIVSNYNFVIGPDFSSQCNYISNFENDNTIFISPNSSSNNLFKNNLQLYRMKCVDSNQGYIIAKFLIYLNITKVILLYSNIQWSYAIVDEFIVEYQKFNGEIILNTQYNPNSNEFSNYLSKFEKNIDLLIDKNILNKVAILHIGLFETSDLLSHISKDSKLRKIIWVGSDAIPSRLAKSYFENNTECFNNITFYAPLTSPHYSKEYYNIEKYYNNNTTNELDFVQCARYDAIWLLAKTIIYSDTFNVHVIKKNLSIISQNFIGLTGNCSLNNYGDRNNCDYNIYKLIDNKDNFCLLVAKYDQKYDIIKIP